jgi:predicted enzyme involved in methoxymalonyl-ACP biosynthesis
MTLSIAPFDAAGRKRIAQLIAKSNQFNLTTRRYSEPKSPPCNRIAMR